MPPETHHPLHLLGHLVTTQVVVEGALGSPVGRIMSDGIGSLAVHLGNHGFLFFLKSNRDASVCGQSYGKSSNEQTLTLSLGTRTWPGRMRSLCTALELAAPKSGVLGVENYESWCHEKVQGVGTPVAYKMYSLQV